MSEWDGLPEAAREALRDMQRRETEREERLKRAEQRFGDFDTYKAVTLDRVAAAERKAMQTAEDINDAWSRLASGGPGKTQKEWEPVLLKRLGIDSEVERQQCVADKKQDNRWTFIANVIQGLIVLCAGGILGFAGKNLVKWLSGGQ